MQSKGTLGSIIAGIIAIFLVLVCLFYLSFTLVSSKQEAKAEQYALSVAGQQGRTPSSTTRPIKPTSTQFPRSPFGWATTTVKSRNGVSASDSTSKAV